MESVTTEKFTYFQFYKKLEVPVYIRLKATDFDPDLMGFLRTMKFDELTEGESLKVENDLADKKEGTRVLTLAEASILVARQIAAARESDRFGPESIIKKNSYNVYRYRDMAMLVYSTMSHEWHLGCFPDFGNVDTEAHCRVVINRFLSWALAPLGFVGFWGTPVDEGVVVQRSAEVGGEAIFFNVKEKKLITQEGQKRMRYPFSFIKLDQTLRDRSSEMKFEELLSYLTINCTYFGAQGLPPGVRQLIQTLSRYSQGHVYPLENFRPRQEAHLTGK